MKVPVIKQHIHIRTVQTVRQLLRIELHIQRNSRITAAHNPKQHRQIMVAADTENADLQLMPHLGPLLPGPGRDCIALLRKLLISNTENLSVFFIL